MATQTKLMTADELLRLPDHGVRRELIQGELHEMPLAEYHHGRIVAKFASPLGQHVEEHQLGEVYAAETGFILANDPDTVRAPDCAFVSQARALAVGNGPGFFPGAPDLAVEVISPDETYMDVEDKVESWLAAGARIVVVVNPRNCTLKVYRNPKTVLVLTIDDTFDGEDVVPGFQLPMRRLFPDASSALLAIRELKMNL